MNRRLRQGSLVLLLLLSACMNPNVGMRTADNAYAQGNCETANSIVNQAAESGAPWAQFRVGQAYLTGKCRRQDYAEAYKWLSKAASYESKTDWENGRSVSTGPTGLFNTRGSSANASLSMSIIHERGLGVEKNMVLSWLWLDRAVKLSESGETERLTVLEQSMSKNDIQRARDASRTWSPATPNRY